MWRNQRGRHLYYHSRNSLSWIFYECKTGEKGRSDRAKLVREGTNRFYANNTFFLSFLPFLFFLEYNISCETDHDRLTIVLSNQTVRFCFERNERLFVFIDKIKRKLLRMLAIICEKKKGHKRVVYNREPSKEEVGRSVNGEIVGQ